MKDLFKCLAKNLKFFRFLEKKVQLEGKNSYENKTMFKFGNAYHFSKGEPGVIGPIGNPGKIFKYNNEE